MVTKVVWLQFRNCLPPWCERRQTWCTEQAAGVPPSGGSHASQTADFAARTLWQIPNCCCLGRWTIPTLTGAASLEERKPRSNSRLIKDARIPTRGSKLVAGHNLYSIENLTIPAHSRSLIKTGLAIAVSQIWLSKADFTCLIVISHRYVLVSRYEVGWLIVFHMTLQLRVIC